MVGSALLVQHGGWGTCQITKPMHFIADEQLGGGGVARMGVGWARSCETSGYCKSRAQLPPLPAQWYILQSLHCQLNNIALSVHLSNHAGECELADLTVALT